MNNIGLEKNFFFGGKSIFTIQSEVTGAWKTYKIARTKPNARFPIPAYMVYLLTGANNETDYEYIGMVNEQTGFFRITSKSRRNDSSPDVVVFKWFMKHLFSDGILSNAKVHHEGRCGCCGRLLTVPESIERGIGPECWARMGGI
jgi:hypothetical protein